MEDSKKPQNEGVRNKNTKSKIPAEKNKEIRSKNLPDKATLKKNPIGTSKQSNNLKSSKDSQYRSVTASIPEALPNLPINKKQAMKKSEIIPIPTSKSIDVDTEFKDETSLEKELELVLIGTPTAKTRAHTGIPFIRTKRSKSPLQNIFKTILDGSSSVHTSSSHRSPNGTDSVQDPPQIIRKGIQSSPQKLCTEASSGTPLKKCDSKNKENETAFKFQRSQTAHPIKDLTSNPQDIDNKLKTELALEKKHQKFLVGSHAGVPAHSGLAFMPKKPAVPVVNIFESKDEGSTRVKLPTSSRPMPRPCLRPQAAKPKAPTVVSKESKNATEKAHSGANFAVPNKSTVPKKVEKGTSKLQRSKTDIAIKPALPSSKPIQRVQSFSRTRPEPIAAQIAKKPAHEAILDISITVKEDIKVTFPKISSAHSGIPFLPKKPSKCVNIFASKTDDASKPSKK